MQRDPLSAILSLIEARGVYTGGMTVGGKWAFRVPPPPQIKLLVVARGRCFVSIDGEKRPRLLVEGDVFLNIARRPYTIGAEPGLKPCEIDAVYAGAAKCQMIDAGGGDDVMMIGSHIELNEIGLRLLTSGLPPIVHLRASDAGADQIQWLIREMMRETGDAMPGAETACSGMVELVFLHLLRAHILKAGAVKIGWLRAACDPKLAPALGLMHGDPARDWHLPELAKAAAMSRTAFAAHFKTVAGMAPLAYLTEWRMRLAERELRESAKPVARIARAVGYTSEAAFSTAFKRVIGHSPRRRRAAARHEARELEDA
jgi:AraC-like DNA-binding protein